MKINWGYIKLFLLVMLAIALYSFSSVRSNSKNLKEIDIEFLGENELFVTEKLLNKLLIQSKESVTNQAKETLALSKLEAVLKAHDMVQDADVYLTVDGILGANVRQRTPIARVQGINSFYIDSEGVSMPLSTNRTARVPLVTGVLEQDLQDVYSVAKQLVEDDFMQKSIVSMERLESGDFVLSARKNNFKILLGKANNLEKKFKNYKAFYQKVVKDKTIDQYKTINLKYEHQVVCTKK